MKAYFRQIRILAAIGLALIAVVFLMIAFTPLGGQKSFRTGAGNTAAAAQSAKVNINTASAEDLQLLPDIGKTRAQRIIAYRETHGAFQSTEQIMLVDGIGEKTYAQIKDYICV